MSYEEIHKDDYVFHVGEQGLLFYVVLFGQVGMYEADQKWAEKLSRTSITPGKTPSSKTKSLLKENSMEKTRVSTEWSNEDLKVTPGNGDRSETSSLVLAPSENT
jgi:hypothetical protein